MGIILEPRLLFDASVGGTTNKDNTTDASSTTTSTTTDSSHSTTDKSTTPSAAPVDQSTAAQAKSAASTTPTADAQKTGTSADPSASKDTSATSATAQSGASGATASSTPIDSVLFVDPRVSGWQELANSVSASTKVVVIDPTLDGITQVTQTLSTLHGIKEVDFLTYGQSGQIELGSSMVTDASLMANATSVAAWRNSLTDTAQIQFWGCDVGAGTAGAAFVNDLHTLTGVGIAASTDATGAAALGGDWNLERTVGTVTPFQPFSVAAEASYNSVLDTPLPEVSFSGLPSSVLLGDSFTTTVSFLNGATNAAGYAPYIELFVPGSGGTGQTESATLTSATYLGTAVTVQTITLTTDSGGHVGAIDPNVLNSAGVAQFVQAPTGFRAGDTMYVLALPFGSFTAGQPKADVTLTFQLDNRSNLGASALDIQAVGVFKYGDNATGIDASIRGTGTANTSTTPDTGVPTGLSNETATVSLINVTSTVITYPGEGETATGPSFPGSYVISITPAPATDGDSLHNLVVTYTLPDTVQWNGNAITFSGQSGTVDTTGLSTTTPGGSFTVTYATLASASTSTSAVASTITVPFYVPEVSSSGAQIISDSGGTVGDVTHISLTPTYTYTATSWTPVVGAFAGAAAQAVSGTGGSSGDPQFDAKSIAIQVTDNIGPNGLLPGQTITYTIHFQISDYFDIDNLVINNILGDGMTLVPGTTPVLTINNDGSHASINFGAITAGTTDTPNGQAVALAGGNSFWNYSRNDTTGAVSNANVTGTLGAGSTAMSFNIGALLTNASLAHLLQGGTGGGTGGTAGTTGTITFQATSLEMYTETNSLQSIREGDSVSDSITQGSTGGGTIISHVTGDTQTQYDLSSVTNTEATGTLTLTIDQIADALGNVLSTTDFDFQAGDLVTYTLDYTLTAGDYGALNLNAFLPLPVLGVPTTFTNDGTGLAAGTFKIISNPSAAAGNNPTTAVGDPTKNSVDFNFGTFNTNTDTAGQHVTVQFTVQASANPFVNGLLLTTQGQSTYTPYDASPTTVATAAAIQQQHILEPELVTKTGIVSDRNDSNTNQTTSSYTPDTGAGSANPTTIFEPANTGSGTGVNGTFLSAGVIPTAIGNAENQNLTGADGGDTVRIVQTIQNTGQGQAYDVYAKGTLPTGYTAANVSNLTVTLGDGTTLTFNAANNAAAIAAYFSGSGVQVEKGGSVVNAVLSGSTTAATAIMYVSYDLALSPTQTVGTLLTATGAIANWSASHGATGFVTGGTAVGVAAANLTDNATITTSSPTLTKTITAGDDTTNVPLNGVVVGETVTYTFVLTIPEGGMSNVAFNDVMPTFLTNVAAGTITFGTGVTHTGDNTLTVSGNTVSANFGTVVNGNADTPGTITFTVTAKVANSTNVDGTTISNTGTITSTGIATLNSTAVATEKDPLVHETLTDNAGGSAVHSGQTVTYTLVLQNDGDAPAQDLLDSITLPAGLTFVPNSITQTGGSTTGVTLDQTGKTVGVSQLGVGAGNKLTFTFQATVDNNLASNTPLQVTTPASYTSMPGTVAGERSYNATGSDTVTTGVFTPTLVIVDQSNGTSATDGTTVPSQAAPTSATDAVVGEIVRMKAYVEIPEGQNTLDLAVTLPAGLTFLNDGSTTVALASPNGQVLSSTIDPTGTNGAIQVNDTTGFNVATYNPTAAMTSGISTAGNVVHFDFGTVQNNANSTTKNYAIVEFNAVVTNVAGNQSGTVLSSSVQANGTGTTSSDTVNVKEPAVTIAKTITGINQATGTVTWQVVVTNTGAAGAAPTAYDVNLTDAESAGAQTNEGTISGLTSTGTASGLTVNSGNGTTSLQATMNLAAGASETFTYTTTLTDKTAKLSDSTASVTWTSINSGVASTFYGTSDNAAGGGVATAGTTDGERTGADGVGGALNDYDKTATIGLTAVAGNVWNDVGSPLNLADQALDSAADSELASVTVTGTWSGGSGTVTTNGSGNYSILLPDNVSATIGVPTTIASFTLVYDTDGTSGSASPNHVETGLSSSQAKTTIAAGAAAAYSGVNFAYRLPDAAPTIGTWGASAGSEPTYTVGGAAVTLHAGTSTSVSDSELDTLVADSIGDYSGTVLTIARNGGANANDVFGGGGTSTTGLFLSGGTVKYNGATIGSYTMSGGTLAVTFGSGTSSSDVTNVLNNVNYSNATSQLAGAITINATLTDNNTETGTTAGNNFQGTGGVKTSNIATALLDIAPTAVAATFTEPNDTPASGASVALAPALTIGTGSQTFTSVVLAITPGTLQSAEDVLTFTNTANITGSYNAATGTMTLTNTGGATVAQWQAALRSVQYYDTSDAPNTSARTVTIAATTAGGDVVNGTLATVSVVSVDDSPILNTGVAVSLPHGTEDGSGVPSGSSAGFLVSSLAGTGLNVTDPDGSSTGPATTGIAITHADTSEGTWWYTTNNGTTWTQMTAITGSNVLQLVANANTRLYFQPTVPDWNGQIANGLTFRAWDQFNPSAPGTPVANGTYADLSAITNYGQNATNNTTGSAYSIATDTLPLIVDAVNDAPIAAPGTITLVTPGSTVTTLFTPSFSDTADQRQTVGNPTGSVANTLAGIAITGDAANPVTQGTWQYSVDGGATYTAISTSVADNSAVILPNTALIKFVGVAGYTGTPGSLTVRLIDSSTDVSIPGGVGTGLSLQGGHTAYTGIDVSGANDGGRTAVSVGTVPLTTIVSGSVSSTYTEPNDSPAIGAEVPVNSTVILSLNPSGAYTSATFQITGNLQAGEDVLAFTNDGVTMGNITGAYNAGTGTITLISTGGTATPVQWQAALRAIQYYDSSDAPNTTARTVTMNINETGVGTLALGTSTVSVVSVDDSPILNTGVAVSLPHGTEDGSGVPSGSSAGFLVSSLAGTGLNVTDPDGSSTGPATTGIAITHADTSEGTWWYTTNNGTTWTQMTAITGSNVLQLVANANTRLYFQPTVPDWNGQIANGLTFRAWDQFNPSAPGTPVANGTYADLSAITNYGQNATNNTTGSAYSIATDTLPLIVDAVNDAPIATGSASLPAVTQGDPPATATVTTLFTPSFSDTADQQQTVGNPTGSVANTLAGIAIVGDAATPGQGAWKYSLDGGTTWVSIPTTGLSNTTALILPKTAMLEFVGASGYSGTPGALSVRLIDSSNGAVAFSASTDVSTNGGSTAISANTVPLDTVVNAVPVPFNPPPIPPSDVLSLQRDSLYNGGPGQGGYIFTGGLQTDWLLGENVFRVMEVGIPGVANVSADVFYGTVPKQNLYFEAVNLSGGSLPPWLFFDTSTLRFSGTPPEGSEGTIDARVIARDFKGREAVADVHIVIVREQAEILGLLRTSNNDRPPITVPNPPPQGSPPPDAGNGTPIIIDGRPAGNAPQPSGNTPPSGDGGAPRDNGNTAPSGNGPAGGTGTDGRQGFGLSPQLREFSQAGRLARARSLLNALSAGPAAL
jgi:uncharacterized repeat protein (TIGR01451 family)